MIPTVIFDIDGTLASCDHRLHLLPDYDAFYELMLDDPPIRPIVDMARAMLRDHGLIFCTGRPERHRAKTEAWLARHWLPTTPLYMRRDDDHRDDHVIKREMLEVIRSFPADIRFVVEDRASVVKMWREEGLLCLQCAEGNF